MLKKNKMIGLSFAILLSSCGGASESNKTDASEASSPSLPTTGVIDTGETTSEETAASGSETGSTTNPNPPVVMPSQPTADNATLVAGTLFSFASSSQLVSVDLENNFLLAAFNSANEILLLDVNDPNNSTTLVHSEFASTVSAVTTVEEEDDDDDTDDDLDDVEEIEVYATIQPLDDDYTTPLIQHSNALMQASFDVINTDTLWAVVPYTIPGPAETALGITYSDQYGVYTGAKSLLASATPSVLGLDNSANFTRATTIDAAGNAVANTGYIQRTLQAASGRMLGWQVYDNGTSIDVSLAELNNQAQVISLTQSLGWSMGSTLVTWALSQDGNTLALIVSSASQDYNLHVLDITSISAASISLAKSLPLVPATGSGEMISDAVFFNSDQQLAIAIGNRIEVIDVASSSLDQQTPLSYADQVNAVESDYERGFLAVLHGNSGQSSTVQLLSVENVGNEIAALSVAANLRRMDMDKNNLVVFSDSQYQVITLN